MKFKMTIIQKLTTGAKAGFQGGNKFNSMIMNDKNIMRGIYKFGDKEVFGELKKQTWRGDGMPKERPIFDEDGNLIPPYETTFGFDKMITGCEVDDLIMNGIENLMKYR